MTDKTTPRIYCLPATQAPIVAVFRRGPSKWSHIGRWDLAAGRYEPGAWFSGRIFPRRSELSPDGRYLCYFAHQPLADWEHGETYVAVARLPWLTALHALPTCGTWTRGYRFTDDADDVHPDDIVMPIAQRLRAIPVVQFANERRRCWQETGDSPPRAPSDVWDQHRNARLHKYQPGGDWLLYIESRGWSGGEFGVDQAVDGLRVSYWLESVGDLQPLDHLQWADWDREGRLLAATRSGKLQVITIGEGALQVVFEEDLTRFAPQPEPPPDWARHW